MGDKTEIQPGKIASSMSAVPFAVTVTLRRTMPASLLKTISWWPGLTSFNASGVTPRGLPSTITCAPIGVDFTFNAPVALRATVADGVAAGFGRAVAAGLSLPAPVEIRPGR